MKKRRHPRLASFSQSRIYIDKYSGNWLNYGGKCLKEDPHSQIALPRIHRTKLWITFPFMGLNEHWWWRDAFDRPTTHMEPRRGQCCVSSSAQYTPLSQQTSSDRIRSISRSADGETLSHVATHTEPNGVDVPMVNGKRNAITSSSSCCLASTTSGAGSGWMINWIINTAFGHSIELLAGASLWDACGLTGTGEPTWIRTNRII